MGNDMFNDEQLAHAEIVQKETEDALGWWKERALKAEAERDALLSRPAPPADAATEAVRLLQHCLLYLDNGDFSNGVVEYGQDEGRTAAFRFAEEVRTFLSSPAPAPEAKETRT